MSASSGSYKAPPCQIGKEKKRNNFVNWYRDEKRKFNNSFQILCENFLNFPPLEHKANVNEIPINILVGCTNRNTFDYERFSSGNFYALFIDSKDDDTYEPVDERQYDMYTIYIEDVYSVRNQLHKIPPNIILNIHFDISVSYFCSAETYFKVADYLLVSGGKMIFNYGIQHGTNKYSYLSEGIFTRVTNPKEIVSATELEKIYNVIIDIDSKQILYGRDHYINNALDPQNQLSIVFININGKEEQFTKTLLYDYIDYLRETYQNFSFTNKTYTLQDYSYPVPMKAIIKNDMKLIMINNNKAEFILNTIMNVEDRLQYLETRTIPVKTIHKIIDKILSTEIILTNFIKLFNDEIVHIIYENLTRDKIELIVVSLLNYPYKYIEATKK